MPPTITLPRTSGTTPAPSVVESLGASAAFQNYRLALHQLAGLDLRLLSPGASGIKSLTADDEAGAPSFCVLMAQRSTACLSCLEEERAAVANLAAEPAVFECFPGLRRIVGLVRLHGQPLALLQAGPMLAQAPSAADTHRLARQLSKRGIEASRQPALQAAFHAAPVVPPERGRAIVRLLQTIAEHLAFLAVAQLRVLAPPELSAVERAVRIIEEGGATGTPSLAKVACAVGLSARHFSEVFHRSTGETFTACLARTRIERAKGYLRCSSLRIGEVAERSGFCSVSQFNRTFRRLTGDSPKSYRAKQMLDRDRGIADTAENAQLSRPNA